MNFLKQIILDGFKAICILKEIWLMIIKKILDGEKENEADKMTKSLLKKILKFSLDKTKLVKSKWLE